MKRLAPVLLPGFGSAAFSCAVPPLELFRAHASLVEEATSILLVEAVADDAKAEHAVCQLLIVRTLKGAAPESLSELPSIACRLPAAGNWMTDFAAHTDTVFWERREGRLGVTGHCTPCAACLPEQENLSRLSRHTPR
ncbi:MAG: hypothetical protein LBU11_05930 [Zoogloeaceae bacterium]|jgi:hypothetical protein|nr:hypothetical protein [Zoogloeaceae bacterium]